VDTLVTLRGRIEYPRWWNPHDGSVTPIKGVRYRKAPQGTFTEFVLSLPPVSSIAVVGARRD
jgi:hypothetical protein